MFFIFMQEEFFCSCGEHVFEPGRRCLACEDRLSENREAKFAAELNEIRQQIEMERKSK
jgi:hypothetical protein